MRPGREYPRGRVTWMHKVRVRWDAAFPPVSATQGYAKRFESVDEALRLPAGRGGWKREHRPSVVIIYDPSHPPHERALRVLDNDMRFKAASRLFNRFRVDVRGLPGTPPTEVVMRTYLRDGTPFAETRGARRIPEAYRKLERTFEAAYPVKLNRLVNYLQDVLGARASIDDALRRYERKIVCEHCGGADARTVAHLEKLRERKKSYDNALGELLEKLAR